MKVTGYMLKEQIKVRMLQLDSLYARFDDLLYAFPDESKNPELCADEILDIESDVVLLQVAQKHYNLNSTVVLPDGNEVSLEQIIKAVGPTARIAKRWRKASKPQKDNYYRRESVRKPDEIYEERTIEPQRCLELAMELETYAAKMRSIIAEANSIKMEIDWLDSSLFG